MIVLDRLNALADPLRLRILQVLALEELAVGELVRVLQCPQPTVSRHLKQLDDAGWITRRRDGTAGYYRMRTEAIDGLWAAVQPEVEAQFPDDRRRLDALLASRSGDSAELFRRLGGRWDGVRRELFGDAYLIPTFLSLLPEGLTVADLGCGTGAMLPHLAAVAGQVIGVDRERTMLDVARERSPTADLRQGLLDALPIASQTVDIAICALVLHHVRDLEPVFAEVARVLKPNGRWLILDMVEHDREEFRLTMGHQHLGFAESRVRELAAHAGLRVTRCLALDPDPEAVAPALFLATCVWSPPAP